MISSTLLYGALELVLVLKVKAHPDQLTHVNQIMLNHEIGLIKLKEIAWKSKAVKIKSELDGMKKQNFKYESYLFILLLLLLSSSNFRSHFVQN